MKRFCLLSSVIAEIHCIFFYSITLGWYEWPTWNHSNYDGKTINGLHTRKRWSWELTTDSSGHLHSTFKCVYTIHAPGITLLPSEVNVFATELPFDLVGFTFQSHIVLLFGIDSAQGFRENNGSLCHGGKKGKTCSSLGSWLFWTDVKVSIYCQETLWWSIQKK